MGIPTERSNKKATMNRFYFLLLPLIFIIFNKTYSQSIGFIYEASSFNQKDLFYTEGSGPEGLIKNFFINCNAPIDEFFILSVKAGYGWNKYGLSSADEGSKNSYKQVTEGYPIEAELQYHHSLGIDSVFEPVIGIGAGYYYYISHSSYYYMKEKFYARGFAQYLLVGVNINISNAVTSSIRLKKIMLNSISTKYEEDTVIIERDYAQVNGFDDLSFSLGIFFNLQY